MKLLISYLGKKGGGNLYSYEMSKALIKKGHIVDLILSSQIENIDKWKQLEANNITCFKTYNNFLEFLIRTPLFAFKAVYLRFKNKNTVYDVVYTPMIQPWSLFSILMHKYKQNIVTLHDPKPHSGTNKLLNFINKIFAKKADKIVILSETFKLFTALEYSKSIDKIKCIPHGAFDYKKVWSGKGSSLNFTKNNVNFLFFGRIAKYKGVEILLEAFERLSQDLDNVTLNIVGSGDISFLKNKIIKSNNIKLVNRWIKDEEVNSFFTGPNTVTVLPYIDATQSGVVPIAWHNKSLVIASNAGGLAEQIVDQKTGLLFETKKSTELYNVMKDVALNLHNYHHIIDSGYKKFLELNWDNLADDLIDFIGEYSCW